MEKIKNFSEILKALLKTAFLVFVDRKKEIAVYKEKNVDLSSPKNVFHVLEGTAIHANYTETILDNMSKETLYKFNRTGKNLFTVNPIIAGLIYHFAERIEKKIASIRKSTKDKAKQDRQIAREIKSDLVNLNRFIDPKLAKAIMADNPKLRLTRKNALSSFLYVINVEEGKIGFKAGK